MGSGGIQDKDGIPRCEAKGKLYRNPEIQKPPLLIPRVELNPCGIANTLDINI